MPGLNRQLSIASASSGEGLTPVAVAGRPYGPLESVLGAFYEGRETFSSGAEVEDLVTHEKAHLRRTETLDLIYCAY